MTDIRQLTADALALPLEERLRLAQKLWASCPQSDSKGPETGDAREAIDIALERDRELEVGSVQAVSHEDVMQQARKSLGCE